MATGNQASNPPKRSGSVAAAADRASGERRRRRGIPLIAGSASMANAAAPESATTRPAARKAAV